MTKEDWKKYSEADSECAVRNVLDRLGDKWSMLVIIVLGVEGTLRFNKLHSFIGDISQKMLTVTLKSLEADGLITRTVFPEIPPRVEYALTERGASLLPHMEALAEWAATHMEGIYASREKYVRS
ncbi:winged helix-turn-helix transcriptional regulator [Chitinophaga pinensis]|uniref:Transcriptional regulator, HxlR family n=1 Tax=Chitinophaga pinensis (strain ATCC 43595 / DSM 2588 / LMG 13176 / NBRC 15968 / NCIMB 11800 / UQM 2034) TaxID=485918 RepID=A0A979FZT0_CHIPD|nr:helix-turn-helix domain-containing protein [Chitinophaga pinensis]ACU58137.1 transcriptional regulator, HxlR family [Chitinophaga pinensis DSM 2588]